MFMIQNVLIIRDGIPLVLESFGQCHSIDAKNPLFAGFLEAFYRFSEEISNTEIETVNFKDALLNLKNIDNLLFVIISNREDNEKILKNRLEEIINLFYEEFKLEEINRIKTPKTFSGFRKRLLEREIVQEVCGLDYCDLCPTLIKEETTITLTKELNKIKK